MRVVSFTNHLEFEFQGNVFKNAVCLGDVDNDGLNEVIVGNDKGDLAVFKGENSKPACLAKGLGIITAITVGDILNVGKNVLFVVTACGQCRLYEFDKDFWNDSSKKSMVPFHSQRIPANIKIAYIGDVNGDGSSEVVVGLTDRVVRTFRWISGGQTSKDKLIGKLVGLNKWEFAEQVGVTLHKTSEEKPCIIVAQPSGSFITLRFDSSKNDFTVEPFDENLGELTKLSNTLEPLSSSKLRNPKICGNIINKFDDCDKASSLAIATLDGHLILVRNGKILWKRSFDHELFAVSCVDWTGDGNEEIVACAWDGNTFIVKHNNEGIEFSFHEPVSAFTSGMFGVEKRQTPCLVYCTFNGTIYLYYDVSVPYMVPKTLLETLQKNDEYKNLVSSMGIDFNNTKKLKCLNEVVLYGVH